MGHPASACVFVCVRLCASDCSYANISPYIFIGSESNLWPTAGNAQYSSATTGLDQLNITEPTSGSYVFVSVFSKDADSRYSILVTGEGRIPALTTYGYPTQGTVSANKPQYYVATVPSYYGTLTNYMLTFTLRSLSGNADLYISDSYLYPSRASHNWTSEAAGDGLDIAVLRGDVTRSGGKVDLHSGNYYVAVRSSAESSYQLWANLRQRQVVQLNTILSHYSYGGVVYYEIDVPRGAGFSITATALAYYGGSFNVYVGNVAEPMPSIASTYQVKNNSVAHVSAELNTCSSAVCRFYVAIERVNNASQSVSTPYELLILSRDVPPTQLLPDTPLEKTYVTEGGTVYGFNVTCPRSKVTITVATTYDQYNGSPMSVNRGPLPPFSSLNNIEFGYAESVSLGRRTFRLSFDWTHPLLRNASMLGRYMLSVRPTYSTAWTLLLQIDGGRCAALPAMTAMQHLMPYSASANATSMAYFSYQTAANATGDLYFTLTPYNSSTSLAGLTILARADGDVPAMGYTQFSSASMGVLRVSASACSNGLSSNISLDGMCQYTVAVGSTTGSTAAFFLTASTGQPLYAMDARVPPAVLAGSVGRGSAVAGTAVVPLGPSAVSLVTEACMGSVSVYVNYRTATIPVASAADLSATSVTTPTSLVLPLAPAAATHLVASIVGVGSASSTFESRLVANLSWSSLSPTATATTLTVTDYRQVSTGRARVRIPLATVPAAVSAGRIRQPVGSTGFLRYAVYVLDKADTATSYNLQSRCGLTASTATLVHTAYGLTSSTNTIDVTLPQPSHRYTVAVLVDHVWRTNVNSRNYTYEAWSSGYIVYIPVDVRGGTKQRDDDSSSSSSGGMALPPAVQTVGFSPITVIVVAVVAVAITLVVVLLAVWYCKRMVSSNSGGFDGDRLLSGHDSKHSSLPADSFVQSHLHQGATQLTGEAFYAMPPADKQ